MRSTVLTSAIALTACVSAAALSIPTTEFTVDLVEVPSNYVKGFRNPSIQSSAGGKVVCVSGTIDVTASANHVQLNIQAPANQTALTELVVETLQINSTVSQRINGGQNPVSGTYGIYSELCFPNGKINATTVQFLIHGIGFDRTYWNIAPDYSYVNYAAEQGYTTFSYDRLGTGLSDRPDAIQVVQPGLQAEIAHELIQLLRSGGIAGETFEHVVGVGHSFGSFQTMRVTAKYPDDLDAAVLTGFSADNGGMPVAFASVWLEIAPQNQPLRFADLPNGYFTSANAASTQAFFFRAPGFDPLLLDLGETTKQTISMGEFLTGSAFEVSKNFTGPIDVVNGENDLPNCHGNCLAPVNLAAAVKDALYPAASNGSSWFIAPGSGHGLNFHYVANSAYEHIHKFIKSNGF